MDTQPLRAGGELTEIIDRYQTTVFGLALAKTGSRADADDVFQEVFLAYYQSGKTFRDEEHRKAWLLRTTLNLCRRVTQSSWRKKTVPLSQREDAPVRFQEPEENRVWQALCGLEEAYRLPLYLFYFQELSTRETVWLADSVVDTAVQPVRSSANAQKKGKIRFIIGPF